MASRSPAVVIHFRLRSSGRHSVFSSGLILYLTRALHFKVLIQRLVTLVVGATIMLKVLNRQPKRHRPDVGPDEGFVDT